MAWGRDVFAAVSMYSVGISVNALQLVFMKGILYYGPSGVLYAFFGIVFGFAVLDTLDSPFKVKLNKILSRGQNYKAKGHFIVNITVLLLIAGWIYLDTGSFLSKARNVDYATHGTAFLGGAFLTLIFGLVVRHLFKKRI